MKRFLRSLVNKVVPHRWMWAARLAFVPGSYREILKNMESVIELPEELRDDDYRAQRLRKFAHILDKGLQRLDSEPGHSQVWYDRARGMLSQIQAPDVLQDESVAWARARIQDYERLQDGHRPAHTEFETCGGYEQLSTLIRQRRSIRFYGEQPVDLHTIEKVVEVVNWSSTSCNRQTAKVFVVNELPLVQACLGTCVGATNFSEYVPVFFCFCADLRAYTMPHELYLPVLDVALGVQNSALIAHSLGLSITLLTWAQHTPEDDRKLRELLGIPSYYQIVVNGVMGYPAFETPTPLRKSMASTLVLRRESFGGASQGAPEAGGD